MNIEKQIRNYIQRQSNWIKANNLKPGDKVLIRRYPPYQSGWQATWSDLMDKYIGKIVTVKSTDHVSNEGYKNGITFEETGPFVFPYTILQKVE